MRLIDANALQNLLLPIAMGLEREYGSLGGAIAGVMQHIDAAPTIDPESLRPNGRWIIRNRHTVSKKTYLDDNYHIDVICSECSFCIQAENASFGFPEPIKTNYCPNCGANMKEETECPKM